MINSSQQAVSRVERTAGAKDKIIPMFNETNVGGIISAWGDNFHFIINAIGIDMSLASWGASFSADSNPRDWNATPASMGQLDAEVNQAQDSVADLSLVKDWVDAQRSSLVAIHIAGAQLLIELALQFIIRSRMPILAKSDSFASNELIWSIDTWENFLRSCEYRGVPITKFAVNFARSFVVYWQFCAPNVKRSMPSSYFMPLIHHYIDTEMEELRDYLMGLREGLIHAEKAKLAYTKFSRKMVEAIAADALIPAHSARALFFKHMLPYQLKDAGGTLATITNANDGASGNGTSVKFPVPASDAWALYKIFNLTADEGILLEDKRSITLGNDEIGCYMCAFMESAAVEGIPAGTQCIAVQDNIHTLVDEYTYSKSNGGGATTFTPTSIELLVLRHPEHLFKTGLGENTWLDFMREALKKMFYDKVM